MSSSRYTVTWLPEVDAALVEYWMNADAVERQRVTRLVNHIDRILGHLPERQGEPDPLDPTLRVWFTSDFPPPVRVAFGVWPADRLVRVARLAFFRQRA